MRDVDRTQSFDSRGVHNVAIEKYPFDAETQKHMSVKTEGRVASAKVGVFEHPLKRERRSEIAMVRQMRTSCAAFNCSIQLSGKMRHKDVDRYPVDHKIQFEEAEGCSSNGSSIIIQLRMYISKF